MRPLRGDHLHERLVRIDGDVKSHRDEAGEEDEEAEDADEEGRHINNLGALV